MDRPNRFGKSRWETSPSLEEPGSRSSLSDGGVVYQESTEGILVRVRPAFSLPDSSLRDGRFVFTYHVMLENHGEEPAKLLFRYWNIHDSSGEDTEVSGEGVVGRQPLLEPGAGHSYKSFCVLRSPAGQMQGHFTFERGDGTRFDVRIPRFSLTAYLPGPDEKDIN